MNNRVVNVPGLPRLLRQMIDVRITEAYPIRCAEKSSPAKALAERAMSPGQRIPIHPGGQRPPAKPVRPGWTKTCETDRNRAGCQHRPARRRLFKVVGARAPTR